jgi:hypothetical protein
MVVLTLSTLIDAQDSATAAKNWHQWRGPQATGVSATANPPLEWSETKNLRWKVEIPGRGSSSPIVWGDRLFVLSAVPVGMTGDAQHAPRGGVTPRGVHRFMVMALDRKTGKTIWERVAREQEPHEASHNDNGTWASGSPITDGERVYAYFESFGLYAYDMNGKLRRVVQRSLVASDPQRSPTGGSARPCSSAPGEGGGLGRRLAPTDDGTPQRRIAGLMRG